MLLTQRISFIPALLAIPFFLGGCASEGSTLSSWRENQILKNAARAVLLGKTFDRATIARRNGDDKALLAAADELKKIDPLSAAEQLVAVASQLDGQAQISPDQSRKKILTAQAAQKYRQALRISPDFPSRDASLLNALGYFLADRGQSKTDFQTSERLTRKAVKLWDDLVAKVEDAPLSGSILAARKFMRAITRDSLAWALFRQKKFEAARAEQKMAVKEAEETAPEMGEKVSADLYFHMAEIERSLKNIPSAKSNYQSALKVEPDHAPSQRALDSLQKTVPPKLLPEKSLPKTLPDETSPPEKPIPDLPEPGGALEAQRTPFADAASELA